MRSTHIYQKLIVVISYFIIKCMQKDVSNVIHIPSLNSAVFISIIFLLTNPYGDKKHVDLST